METTVGLLREAKQVFETANDRNNVASVVQFGRLHQLDF